MKREFWTKSEQKAASNSRGAEASRRSRLRKKGLLPPADEAGIRAWWKAREPAKGRKPKAREDLGAEDARPAVKAYLYGERR